MLIVETIGLIRRADRTFRSSLAHSEGLFIEDCHHQNVYFSCREVIRDEDSVNAQAAPSSDTLLTQNCGRK